MTHKARFSPLHPLVLIPARLASTRLPEKALADIAGRPMIAHVVARALKAELGPVWVATDDARIARAAEEAGAKAVMTRPEHPCGSDRIWEALQTIDPQGAFNAIVNVQGDLPTLDPALPAAALEALAADEGAGVATLVAKIHTDEERNNPAVVKAAIHFNAAGQGRALYFSRHCIPYGASEHWHHIGLYAYRRAALERFVALPVGQLEAAEKLEQLRALEYQIPIAVAAVDAVPLGVDTLEQLYIAREMLT